MIGKESMRASVNEKTTNEEWMEEEPENPKDLLLFVESTINLIIEKVIPEIRRVLTFEEVGKHLGILGKIWNLSEHPPSLIDGMLCADVEEKLMDREGYIDDYQYLHAAPVDMGLTDVSILPQFFVWLLSLDLSDNQLTNTRVCPITKMPNLVALRLRRNLFRDPYMPPMKHLQYLDLSYNRITSLHRIYHPNLETLNLNHNKIRGVYPEDCWKLVKLKQLELRGNHLVTTSGIEYASLVNLYLACNKISKLKGLHILINLKRLHLRNNPLSDLTGFTEMNENLEYLNLRECGIQKVDDLIKLKALLGLRELIIKGNVFNPQPEKTNEKENSDESEEEVEKYDDEENEENEEIRLKILSFLPKLKRIDKKLVSREELENMKEMMQE